MLRKHFTVFILLHAKYSTNHKQTQPSTTKYFKYEKQDNGVKFPNTIEHKTFNSTTNKKKKTAEIEENIHEQAHFKNKRGERKKGLINLSVS